MVSAPSIKSTRLLKGVGYTALFLVVFVATLWTVFPYNLVRGRIENELAAQGIEARIGTLRAGSFPGIQTDRVLIDRVNGKEVGIALGPTSLHVSLGSLLDGQPIAEVESESFGGLVRATGPTTGAGTLSASWRDVDLAQLSKAIPPLEIAMEGLTTGQLTLDVPPPPTGKVTGKVETQLRSLAVGPGTIKGITVPRVLLGSGPFSITADKGRIQIENSQLSGGELELSLEGSLMVGPSLQRSTVDGTLTLRPTPEAQKKLGLVFGLLSEHKDADGNYIARFRGSLSSPRLRNR